MSAMIPDEQSKLAGKRVVVLGAGYVGSAMLASLCGSGAQLTALTRNAETAAGLRARGLRVLQADLAGEGWHAELSEGADFVLNCVGGGGGGADSYRHSYLGGMRSVLAWCSRAPVGHLVYTSSISVYAAGGGVLVDETGELVREGGASAVLVEAEEALLRGGPGPLRRHVLRLAGIYGPGRHRFLDQLVSGDLVAGHAERHLNLVHVDDILSSVLAVWQAPAAVADGVFNVVDDGSATRGEIAAWLAQRLGRPMSRFSGEAAEGRSRSAPDRVISNLKIKGYIGWKPVFPSFREGYGALLTGVRP